MTEKEFDFWQDHSEIFLEMALRTDRDEKLLNPDGYGKNTGDCGDTIEMFLTVKDTRIDQVSLHIDGCINTRACAYTVARFIEGGTVQAAWEVTTEQVIDFLKTLPEASHHCAELAIGALYRALNNFQTLSRDPWKKCYMKS